MNTGHSSRLRYDNDAYSDRLRESTDPINYRLADYQIFNNEGCLSTNGPRCGLRGYGVSNTAGNVVAPSQALVDVESVLSNRNVKTSKSRARGVNPIDVTKFGLRHARICNSDLTPESSRLSHPSYNYRDLALNRFYNLPRDPQANVFWDFAVNTSLEAKDNFVPDVPVPFDQSRALPKDARNKVGSCMPTCTMNSKCPIRK